MSVSKNILNILLFDLYQGGHHVQYIELLGRYWLQRELPGRLDVVVHGAVAASDPRLHQLSSDSGGTIRVHGLYPRTDLEAERPFRPARNDLEHGRLLRHAVTSLAPDHCLCMYFDHIQLSLARGLRLRRDVSVSGIYFRPTFHYPKLNPKAPTWQQLAKGALKRSLLGLAMRHPSFKYLFSLDPYVIDHLPRHRTDVVAVALPDGVPAISMHGHGIDVRAKWGLAVDRKLAVLFGVLDERKGIRQVLKSGFHLPEDVQANLAILFAGPVRGKLDWLAPLIEKLEQETRIRIILDDRFLQHDEAAALLAASDIVLVPYQKHVGSSNVLIRAAQAQRPVIGQDFGLMGAEIRRWKLGLAVDTQSPAAIADAITRIMRAREAVPFDRNSASGYAASHTGEAYARTVFDHLYST